MLNNINVIAVIGAGRIGSAIITSLKKCFPDIKIYATGRREATLENARRLGAIAYRDNNYVVKESDLIILAVKPHHFPAVVQQVDKERWEGKIVISIMAGVRLVTLKKVLKGAKLYRAMPNINVVVGKSSTAIASHEENCGDHRIVEEVFKCMGSVYWVPEEFLDIWTALAGSAPAFITEIIDALVLGAVALWYA